MHAPTLSPLKHFITPIFQPVIHRSKKRFIKGEAQDYLELTLLKHYLNRASQTSKHISLREDTQRTVIKQPSSEVTFEDRNQALRRNKNKTRKSCPFVMLRLHHPAVPKNKFSFSFRKFQ